MEAPAEICENYQLKWNSYTSYIHSCIASSLVAEDSFADVALVTMDGHKIMAHRFVLSYSSQYLNKALKFQPKVTTALPVMIVLPQGISYKALKILVKYMYSGEAKVPKDILNTVLQAGDVLKIKGLCREPIDKDTSKLQKSKSIQVTNTEVQAQKERSVKIPETSPVISKNPPPLVASSSVAQKILLSQSEAIKAKEVHKVQKIFQSKMQKPQEKVVTSSISYVKQYGGPKVLNFTMSNFNGMEKENATSKDAILLKQKVAQEKPHTITSADAEYQDSSDSTPLTNKGENGKNDNLSYLVIKDEPLEWTESEMEIVEENDVFVEESVKTETYDTTSNDGSCIYTPLTCELCTETFTIPGDWVKHVQTHTDMLPAKRRRRDSPDQEDENASYPELQCDLCDKSFSTPAEWVRHIQDTHTDFELSLSNRKNENIQPKKKSSVKKYKLTVN